jgi:hypothetical protein
VRRARVALLAVWEFIVGDDWPTALGVVVTLALTAVIASVGVPAWWVTPLAVAVLLVVSIRRTLRVR